MDIMKHVDILDLVEVVIVVDNYGSMSIDFLCREPNKRVVIDENAKIKIERDIASKLVGKSKNDENALGYAKEFAGKMLSALYQNGLVELEDIPEAPDDPYKSLRNVRNWND